MSDIQELKQQLKELNLKYAKIKTLPQAERKAFGERLNRDKQTLLTKIATAEALKPIEVTPIDLTAPFDINASPIILPKGTKHPLTTELDYILNIYSRMGFDILESRQLDDEFHMFESLNFPKDHPARDSYDTFRTAEGFIPPAHTSTMQYRALRTYRDNLAHGGQIAVVIPGRCFRNEDVDTTHEHTFYQCEGVFVSENATLGQMLGVLKHFFESYYEQELHIKTQPGYFPFTEPSLELMIERPKSLGGKGWLEMLGCGMIHPNVLKTAGIDPKEYRGFAWGGGIDRLVMLKYQLQDIRYFASAKLDFLKEF